MSDNFIVAVTTAKESEDTLKFFIEKNREYGVDHFFIFYEGELNRDAFCEYDSYVTFVDSLAYSKNVRNLNARQIRNINFVNKYLDWAGLKCWITNIDTDEFLHLKKSDLQGVSAQAIRLDVIEPVVGRPDLYKKALSKDELSLAALLGFIEEKSNKDWLRGHPRGKLLFRPNKELEARIHVIEGVPLLRCGMHIIHREGYDFDSFKSKFLRHAETEATHTPSRQKIVDLFRAFKEKENFNRIVHEIFQNEFLECDVERKEQLGLLFPLGEIRNDSSILEFEVELDSFTKENKEFRADSLRGLAIAYERQGDIEAALEAMTGAKELRPKGLLINRKIKEYENLLAAEG
ncbi:hypothetical protein ACJJIW_20115 [Microbulbifer sp. JMSA004]|uniref:hypothetical protein n=1 Tax=unclassified Microbulbifer TaxID=2619833 RepID=UPI0024AD82E4|nr:hypothetical protein [Microbulbifer sp. VAAF005]WHI46624.1 hypothetical protein P0078_23445 [Microbulbifer sp. VAAF005]